MALRAARAELVESDSEAVSSKDSAARRTPNRSQAWWRHLAAAVVVAAIGLYFFRPSPETTPDRPSVRGGLPSIDRLEPTGPLSRSTREMVFTWDGPEGLGYRVSFLSIDGRLLHTTEVAARRLVLGGATRAILEREPECFWKVEALPGGGGLLPQERVARISWNP